VVCSQFQAVAVFTPCCFVVTNNNNNNISTQEKSKIKHKVTVSKNMTRMTRLEPIKLN